MTNRQILLKQRPTGASQVGDFEVVDAPMPSPGDGEILCRTIYLSLDPYMRGRMNEGRSYATPAQVGRPMVGGTVSEVVESRHPGFARGDLVAGYDSLGTPDKGARYRAELADSAKGTPPK